MYATVGIKRLDNNFFHIPGFDYGTDLKIIEENQWKILAYVKGTTQWSGIGETKYYPPHFIVFTKDKDYGCALTYYTGKDGSDLIKDPLGAPEFEYRRGGRKEALAKAMAEYQKQGE